MQKNVVMRLPSALSAIHVGPQEGCLSSSWLPVDQEVQTKALEPSIRHRR